MTIFITKVAMSISLLIFTFCSFVSVAALYTPLGDVEEIFNPLGVSLGASES
jgi:hypothetical protein